MQIIILAFIVFFIIFLIEMCLFFIVRNKKAQNFCHTIDELYNNFFTHKEKFNYLPLHQSNSYEQVLYISTNKNKKLFCENFLYKNINFLLTLSKFIDLKINSSKQTFRAKRKRILIEEIASVVAYSVIYSNNCNLFKLYKKLSHQYNIKNKENKIFKLLLGQKLIYILFQIESEIMDISKIIKKSKKIKKVKKYKKKLYFFAELYSIKKFHKNSTKLLANYKFNYNKIAGFLIIELNESQKKLKIIISYLIAMFS